MKIVMSISGGMDSTTMLALMLEEGHEVHCVHFQYGSKHNKYELRAVTDVCSYYKTFVHVIDMHTVFHGFKSKLMSGQGEIPEGHYQNENMKQTVVPGRNTIFASVMMGYAESIGARAIALGIHSGDHAIYPDCRPEWFQNMRKLVMDVTLNKVTVMAPLIRYTKKNICYTGNRLRVPFNLTRTCYKGQPLACGKCGACNERLEAFSLNDLTDPIHYEERNV